MQLKTMLLISIVLLIPMLSTAEASTPKPDANKLEATDNNIKGLIEKSKSVPPSEERTQIEHQIKKKIAEAHRENRFK